MKDVQGKKVLIGLSGGVDSAVSALLLKQAGAEVTGVFIKGWYPSGMPCTWKEDRRDAMRVAAHLRIPFKTLDAGTEYKRSVIDYLLSEYRAGRTPNPDVMCNRDIKFGVFYRYAKDQRADYIATGHYLKGEKDQRYFLWAVPKIILDATLFPVGLMQKDEVRTLARRYRLPVAMKRDSQGVCFLGSVSVEEFLRSELGSDNPALLYTLGQRAPLSNGPWYVIAKDVEKKTFEVSRSRVPASNTIHFSEPNWQTNADRSTSTVEAQYRYRGPRVKGRIQGNEFVGTDPLPEIPVPGQSIVLYEGDELLGGGIIVG